ncbi:hypothetical protein ACEPAG_7463 [Sanghuangporus baumii]
MSATNFATFLRPSSKTIKPRVFCYTDQEFDTRKQSRMTKTYRIVLLLSPPSFVAAQSAGKLYSGTAVVGLRLNDQLYLQILRNAADFGPNRQLGANTNDQILYGTFETHCDLNLSSSINYPPSYSSVIATHCSTVIGEYAGQIICWCKLDSLDVINEVLKDDGSMHSSAFYNTMDTGLINAVFNAAGSEDPTQSCTLTTTTLKARIRFLLSTA